jgi:hypothetical protein
MSEVKTRYCDAPECDGNTQLEPALYGGAYQLDWYTLTKGNGETHHFCSLDCLKAWNTRPPEQARKEQSK